MTWNVENILKHVENATTPYGESDAVNLSMLFINAFSLVHSFFADKFLLKFSGPFACKEISKIITKSTSRNRSICYLISIFNKF